MNDQYRILIPSEWEALRASIPKTRLRAVVECLLFTGMRYKEIQAFADHPGWFDSKNRAISLPASSSKTETARTIHLTPEYTKDLSMYLKEYKKLECPNAVTLARDLKRWSPSVPVLPKTFRKTWESWLLAANPDRSMQIALSQGHSQLIAYGHYLNMDARLKSEMDAVRRLTEGWGT